MHIYVYNPWIPSSPLQAMSSGDPAADDQLLAESLREHMVSVKEEWSDEDQNWWQGWEEHDATWSADQEQYGQWEVKSEYDDVEEECVDIHDAKTPSEPMLPPQLNPPPPPPPPAYPPPGYEARPDKSWTHTWTGWSQQGWKGASSWSWQSQGWNHGHGGKGARAQSQGSQGSKAPWAMDPSMPKPKGYQTKQGFVDETGKLWPYLDCILVFVCDSCEAVLKFVCSLCVCSSNETDWNEAL